MESGEAIEELERRLAAAGFVAGSPDPATLWAVWRDWCRLPVDDPDISAVDGDLLLFECSLSLDPGFLDGPAVSAHLTRQFSFEDDEGEYDHMEAIVAELRFPVTDVFRAIMRMSDREFGTAAQLWGVSGTTAGAWVAEVEASAAFRVVLAHRANRVELSHTPI